MQHPGAFNQAVSRRAANTASGERRGSCVALIVGYGLPMNATSEQPNGADRSACRSSLAPVRRRRMVVRLVRTAAHRAIRTAVRNIQSFGQAARTRARTPAF